MVVVVGRVLGRAARRDEEREDDEQKQAPHARQPSRRVSGASATAAPSSAGSASTTPATRMPNVPASAPSVRLATGRRPRNAIDHNAMIRPRCDGETPSASRVVADVFDPRYPKPATASRTNPSGSHGTTENVRMPPPSSASVIAIRRREPVTRPATRNAAITAPVPKQATIAPAHVS